LSRIASSNIFNISVIDWAVQWILSCLEKNGGKIIEYASDCSPNKLMLILYLLKCFSFDNQTSIKVGINIQHLKIRSCNRHAFSIIPFDWSQFLLLLFKSRLTIWDGLDCSINLADPLLVIVRQRWNGQNN